MLDRFSEFKLPQIEEKVLAEWKRNQVFQKLQSREGEKGTFHFYEGPPYANGKPGIHHVLSRVFKDIVLRYKTMAGYKVPRRAGWDTHGLPIEIQVEKELGLKTKKDIEKLGIELFNQKAREIIWRNLDEWERFTERIGYWLDLKNAYLTCSNSYIESLWWIFKKISQRGLLKEARKVVPYCPRCETPLSAHELGQPGVYQLTKDPSVYLKFQIKKRKNEYLLVWTTTPWTLPANLAVAVNPKLVYHKYKVGNDYLWSYSEPPYLSIKPELVEKIAAKKMIGWEYIPLYKTLPKGASQATKKKAYRVVAADFVKTDEGTGLVHISPAFGEDDFNLLGQLDFPITIDDQGKVLKGLPGAGRFIKEADREIIADLDRRGLLYEAGQIEHEYPFCWRCATPLIYFARVSWFFEVSRLRKKLLEENEKINWIPAYIKHGRMGEWLKEAKNWAISRNRYWGTPLPIWRCPDCRKVKIIGSLAELAKEAYHQNTFYLLRHGEAEANLKDLIASGPEKGKHISRLTEKGRKQALAAAQAFQKKKIDVILASPYRRTAETARLVAQKTGAPVILDRRLGEVNCGIFNWRPVDERKNFFKDSLEEFTKNHPGGENLNEVKARVFSLLKEVNRRYRNKKILIVSHGDPLWLIEAATKGLSPEEALKLPYFGLGEWREIKFKDGPYNQQGELDVHRPYLDEVYLQCRQCGGKMARIQDVADVWFDSGAMPFAAVHYPFENKTYLESGQGYPADFIAEGIDQTRGWFYTLLATAVLLGKEAPYKNVISLGLIRDKYGQKMSKSKGNVVDPWAMINQYGADTVRWYFYTVNPPADFKDFDEAELAKTLRQFFLLLYHSYIFYRTAEPAVEKSDKGNVMDRWIIARFNETVKAVTDNLDKYEIGLAARSIEELVFDLSRWYIRRSRRRPGVKEVLSQILLGISQLLAPFAPFFAEALYRSLGKKDSVHLSHWPEATGVIDQELLESMRQVRRLAALALAKRNEVGIKVRQPLQSLKVKIQNPELKKLARHPELVEVLKEEINVKEVIFEDRLSEEIELDTRLTPALKEEGIVREFTRLVQDLRKKADLKPQDQIALFIEAAGPLLVALSKNVKQLSREVNAAIIEFKHTDKFDAEWSGRVDSSSAWLGIRKI